MSGGMWCVIAILAALRERERTGQGAVLDIAMTDGVLGFALPTLAAALASGAEGAGETSRGGRRAAHRRARAVQHLPPKDGHAMALAALEPKFWVSFCEGAGLDPDPSALVPGPHQAELKRKLAAVVRERTRAEWEPSPPSATAASSRSSIRGAPRRIPTSPRAISCSRSPRRAAGSPSSGRRSRRRASRSRRRLAPASTRAPCSATRASRKANSMR